MFFFSVSAQDTVRACEGLVRETSRLLAERKDRVASLGACWERTVAASGLSGAELQRVRDAVIEPLPSLGDFFLASLRERAAAAAAGDSNDAGGSGSGEGASAGLAGRLSAARIGEASTSGRLVSGGGGADAGLDSLLRLGPAAAARAAGAAAHAARARTDDGGAVAWEGDGSGDPPADVRWLLRPADQGGPGASSAAAGAAAAAGGDFGPDPWLRRREEAGAHRVYLAGTGRVQGLEPAPGRGRGGGASAGRAPAPVSTSGAAGAGGHSQAARAEGPSAPPLARTAAEEISRCALPAHSPPT